MDQSSSFSGTDAARGSTRALEDARMGSPSREQLAAFVARTSRFERYRYARKTLRFVIYQCMEIYVILGGLAILMTPVLDDGALKTAILANVWGIAVVGVAHNLRLVADMPWLICAASADAATVWAIYHWIISKWVTIPHAGILCVLLAVYRYWDRGENQISIAAFQAIGRASSN